MSQTNINQDMRSFIQDKDNYLLFRDEYTGEEFTMDQLRKLIEEEPRIVSISYSGAPIPPGHEDDLII